MLVFLCRHAQAAPGDPDELRALTPEGERQAAALGARLAAEETPPALVVSSPLLRARQTAETVARTVGADVRIDRRLAPGATAEALRELAGAADGPIATVGHQPDCSEIAVALVGRDPGFPPGEMLALQLDP